MKWLKSIGAFFVALAALFFAYQHNKHRKAQGKLEEKAAKLSVQKVEHVAEAAKAREDAVEHNAKANEALQGAEERIRKLKENGNESLANRIAAFNDRMRDD